MYLWRLSVVSNRVDQLEATDRDLQCQHAVAARPEPTILVFQSAATPAMTIRGFGTSFGLANDGLEAGVGVYVDEVYQGRPAATTFDFLDVSQVEILRGPQGTLFGKNTTAGAINIGIQEAELSTLRI